MWRIAGVASVLPFAVRGGGSCFRVYCGRVGMVATLPGGSGFWWLSTALRPRIAPCSDLASVPARACSALHVLGSGISVMPALSCRRMFPLPPSATCLASPAIHYAEVSVSSRDDYFRWAARGR